MGIFDEENISNFWSEFLPNRRVNSITEFLKRNLPPGSIIKRDGYPLYPQAV